MAENRKRSNENPPAEDSNHNQALCDALRNLHEKLDTTLTENHQNTIKDLISLFVEVQTRLAQKKEERHQSYREAIEIMHRQFTKMERRSDERETQLMMWMIERAGSVLHGDRRQKRDMVELLREDTRVALVCPDPPPTVAGSGGLTTEDSNHNQALCDALRNLYEKLDTTLTEIHQNTIKNLMSLFVEIKTRRAQMKEERHQSHREAIEIILREFTEMERRAEERETQFLMWMLERAGLVLHGDRRQKPAMVELLREDTRVALARLDPPPTVARSGGLTSQSSN